MNNKKNLNVQFWSEPCSFKKPFIFPRFILSQPLSLFLLHLPHMIASSPPLKSTAPGPTRYPNPTLIHRRLACFSLGFRSLGQKLSVGPTTTKMDLLHRMSAGCFTDQRLSQLKVEHDSGGEDIFDAAAKVVPEHLIVMVNGLVGRYGFSPSFTFLTTLCSRQTDNFKK